MSQKKFIACLKIFVLAIILAAVGWNLYTAWRAVGLAQLKTAIDIDWRWSALPPLGFAGVILTGATAWYRLLRRMDSKGSPLKLYGAYCFSQMGKYIPGKVMLLFMRLERTGPLGVSPRATTLSTVMENATGMISCAGMGALLLLHFLVFRSGARHRWLLLMASSSFLVLLTAIHPAVFYRVLNPVLRKLGRPEIDQNQRLPLRSLLLSTCMMTPCWFLGGIALWASARCLVPITIDHFWSLMSAFSLSVLAGIISFLPGGLGVREVVQALFLLPVVTATIPESDALHAKARLVVTLIVMLQRVFQIIAEAGLGLLGGFLTASLPVVTRKRRDPDLDDE
jgi:glycosyltransferase 2 family protein